MSAEVLTINTGSSSLKVTLYRLATTETPELVAQSERIGQPGSLLWIRDAAGVLLGDQQTNLPDHRAALAEVLAWLDRLRTGWEPVAVGHRIVHGGSHFREPQRITDELIGTLQSLATIDPDHLPQALSAIDAISRAFPHVPQVACFDTAFHRAMPRVAQLYALPRNLLAAGVVRYGFHGLSYEYIVTELRRQAPTAADGRLIIAHLGNGASMVAVKAGVSIDTSMGFTPTGGLVMGTRTGDLDPGVLLYLLTARGLSPADLNQLVNHDAGLLGLSGTSSDMRDLLEREASDPRAADAIALFCYQAKKYLGALAAVLGGLDTLVFTGGIGEHAASIRQRICAGLEFLGIHLDAGRNAAHASVISSATSAVTVRVIPTDEDLMIARHTVRVLNGDVSTGSNSARGA